jgi:hypothetical protein
MQFPVICSGSELNRKKFSEKNLEKIADLILLRIFPALCGLRLQPFLLF